MTRLSEEFCSSYDIWFTIVVCEVLESPSFVCFFLFKVINFKLIIMYIPSTGRFIMFSVMTNIYNEKTKGPTLTLRLLMSYIFMERLFLMFLDHKQRRSTVGRTPLDEWSARRRGLYLTTHDILNPWFRASRFNVNKSPTRCSYM